MLISHYLNTFLLDFANHVLLDGFKGTIIVPELLYRSSVGLHTPVFHFSGSSQADGWVTKSLEYVWTHPTKRPHGRSIPMQCPICRAYRPWKDFPDHAGIVNLKCSTVVAGVPCVGSHQIHPLTDFRSVKYNAGVWKVKD